MVSRRGLKCGLRLIDRNSGCKNNFCWSDGEVVYMLPVAADTLCLQKIVEVSCKSTDSKISTTLRMVAKDWVDIALLMMLLRLEMDGGRFS